MYRPPETASMGETERFKRSSTQAASSSRRRVTADLPREVLADPGRAMNLLPLANLTASLVSVSKILRGQLHSLAELVKLHHELAGLVLRWSYGHSKRGPAINGLMQAQGGADGDFSQTAGSS